MKPNYANADPKDWKRWFSQYDRTTIDEHGNVVIQANIMEEIYQMFRARSEAETPKPKTYKDKLEEMLEVIE